MFYFRRELSLFLSFAAFAAMLPAPRTVSAQDLVATENVAGGSSVFVFRESRKSRRPAQAGAASFRVKGLAAGPPARRPGPGPHEPTHR